MAGPSWLVDPKRIATKIRSASATLDPRQINWKSNPTKSCPNCQYVIDNSDVIHVWPGLPRGVKFDPSDQEIIWHLLAKVCADGENIKPHPFIDEFIPTVEEEDGICYTHPQNLPGVKQDGSISHFFHQAVKAYSTGTRKRRKIHGDDSGDVRWHKTGRTKPIHLEGVQKGCKKIMVLYVNSVKGAKAEKTNWVMHQYHLGTGDDEQDGEYVVSKIFYQQQQTKLIETELLITKVDPVTPIAIVPEPPRAENRTPDRDSTLLELEEDQDVKLDVTDTFDRTFYRNNSENHIENMNDDEDPLENKWWENDSQFLLSSQQLVEGLSLCDELLQSQSPNRNKVLHSHYTHLGPENLKRDLEECQKLEMDPANIELDTPPDFRLSQLEFESQDSFVAWGGGVHGPKVD